MPMAENSEVGDTGAGSLEKVSRKLGGPIGVWQGGAIGVGGALLTAMLGMNTLQERSVQDQRRLTELTATVNNMVVQVQSLSVELARQGVYINEIRNTQQQAPNNRSLTNRGG